MDNNDSSDYLKVVYAPGLMPQKWFRRFDQRVPGFSIAQAMTEQPRGFVENGQADIALMRLAHEPLDMDTFHMVTLYQEQPGIAVPKEHPAAVMDEVSVEEIRDEGEIINYAPEHPGEVDYQALRDALSVVAANVGVAMAPRPLLRAINIPGVRNTNLTGTEPSTVAAVWLKDNDNDVIQEFVGITRGRGKGSGRQPSVKKKQQAASHKASSKKK